MKNQNLCTTLFAIVLNTLFISPMAQANETEFQKNSEHVIEQSEEVKDGKHIQKIRSGQVRDRKGTPRVGEIEEGEVNTVQRRVKSLSLTSFGFGPFISSNVGQKAMLYGFSYGKHWEVSTQGEIVAELTAAANSHGGLGHLGLGFNAIPLTSEVSPVIGAELGVGAGNGLSSEKSVYQSGFTFQANAGARLFRLASTQMEGMATYTIGLSSPNLYIVGLQIRVLY